MAKRSDEQLYNLPETSAAGKKAKAELDALLREAHSLSGFEKRLKEVKSRISEIIQQQGLADGATLGVRSGNLCAITRYQSGRSSIKRDLLIENGVTPEQIEASTTQGEGFWICELPQIGIEG